MKKIVILIITAVLITGLVVGGYFYWNAKFRAKPGIESLETAGEVAEKITESATKGVLPSIQTNPLDNKPDINPVDKVNPYKDIKTNPFE